MVGALGAGWLFAIVDIDGEAISRRGTFNASCPFEVSTLVRGGWLGVADGIEDFSDVGGVKD